MDWKIGSRDSCYQFMDTLLYFRTYTRSGTFGIGMEIVPRILLLSYTESIKISHPTLVYEDFSIFEISSPPRTKERKAANDDEWWSMMIRNSFHWIEKFIWIYKMCLDARIYIFFEFIRPLPLVSVRDRYLVESESLSLASFRSEIAGIIE